MVVGFFDLFAFFGGMTCGKCRNSKKSCDTGTERRPLHSQGPRKRLNVETRKGVLCGWLAATKLD